MTSIMAKPVKPTPPREPKAPTKVYRETFQASVGICGDSLASIIDQIKAISTRVFPGADGREIERRMSGMPDLKDVTIETERDYGDDHKTVAKWQQDIIVARADDHYERMVVKHKEDMEVYQRKLAAYEVALSQYEATLSQWEAEKARAAETREREVLARLQSKYPS